MALQSWSNANSNNSWGRNIQQSWITSILAFGMISGLPAVVAWFSITLAHFDSDFSQAWATWHLEGTMAFLNHYLPRPSSKALSLYLAWVLFQAILYTFLPGYGTGQLTPAGNLLTYNINGLLAWQLTIALAICAMITGYIHPTIIAENWEGLLISANMYGYLLSALAYGKAYFWPSHAEDRKFSGIAIYDFYMGIELNPRFGSTWDWKLFHNGRPGIIAWTLIDLSFTAVQYKRFGYVTNSIIIVDILHAVYVLDFFINEGWYVQTVDIAHDHFGFYLAWGSAIWLPTMYTLQVQYLARHPVQLSHITAFLILSVGLGGYAMFRSVNYQKSVVRRTNGDCMIWGAKAKYLRASFTTADGSKHESILLISGWWGVVRHANYMSDLCLSFAMCAPCGTTHLLPWFYWFYMLVLLVHRCRRVEKKCLAKYGDFWKEYTKQVPYSLIPGVF